MNNKHKVVKFIDLLILISIITINYFIKAEALPEWVSIYFAVKQEKGSMKCNLCEMEIEVDSKSPYLIDHLRELHHDIYDLHKHNPQATVGFRVRYDGEIDKTQPIILEQVCASDRAETLVAVESVIEEPESDVINMQYVMLDTKRKHRKTSGNEARKRSWIWKYFDRLSNIVYRCNICNVVLSTKGSNTNNLNRHMRTKHTEIFRTETVGEALAKDGIDVSREEETPYAIKTEEIIYSGRESPSQKARRSWIWSYFDYKTTTRAQCKLCRRHINHGGNATGNMNRHLKMIHHKTNPDEKDNSWLWKVFEQESSFYTCKICQHKLCKNNTETDINAIINHLKKEHGVISGDQIITGTDCELEEN